MPKTTTKKKRVVNYKSRSSAKTIRLQAEIRRWLRSADEGWSVSEMATLLGISRQLCLYHLKKMVATGQIVMVLDPCEQNGGLQFKCWDFTQFVVNYVPAVIQRAVSEVPAEIQRVAA